MRFSLAFVVLAALATPAARSDVRGCECIIESPLTAGIRGCSLCMEAERRPASEKVFVLKDASPTKPNRWLALPRASFDGANPLARMSAEDRLALWTKAIAQGREVWGEGWAVAFNGDISRQQCHLHVHIGKLLAGQEPTGQKELPAGAAKRSEGIYISGPAELPAIADGSGLWFHPAGSRLHVHVGEMTTETVLLR